MVKYKNMCIDIYIHTIEIYKEKTGRFTINIENIRIKYNNMMMKMLRYKKNTKKVDMGVEKCAK